MKGKAFVHIVLISVLLLAACRVCMASNSDASVALSGTQTPVNRTSQPLRELFADRKDTEESTIYSTDPGMERAMEEQAREEKEKEDKSWRMLEHMNLYHKNSRKSPSPDQPDNTPPQ